ncbi:hypothetical protein CAPTEDRAFT_214228 [Capitella teleta]|uniref:Uncharacterized protein n=1 Tax=Capitella teleta TaxID=283909 RepID=R7U4R1_CAPTE|nr:hypothetical protein CAPTEDRAFT_214228 [Capitella teleta]|eukprot:ELU01355.1 hypothetical protein CAPTEDRAFT_214228 [Capitella teleta]
MECITGCLDLYNECPLCKRNISKNDLLFDLDFDKLIVLQQDAIDEHDFASPVIAVLKEHLKQSVDAQDYFFSDLKADHKVKEDDLRKNFNSRLNRDQQETEKHALDLKKLHEKFLNANLPKFDVLPVSIYVEIPTLNSELEFQLKMQDSLDDLRSMVMQSMQQKQMEIAKWDEEARYFLCSPLTEVPSLEQLTSNELTTNEVTELSDTSIPVMQYSMKSGSKLLIAGNFVLEKDTPKPCFRQKQSSVNRVGRRVMKVTQLPWILQIMNLLGFFVIVLPKKEKASNPEVQNELLGNRAQDRI